MNSINYIFSPTAIREQCGEIYKFAQKGGTNFKLHEEKISACADYVLQVIYENYPNLNIPFHSRWRHFGTQQLNKLNDSLKHLSPIEQAKEKWDLVVPSVLLDAGAGMQWKYFDAQTNQYFSKSEGLAIASLSLYYDGFFANADSLLNINAETIKKCFQVTESNPLVGLEGRITLMQNLGHALKNFKTKRISDLIDVLIEENGQTISAVKVLRCVLDNLGSIWPGRLTLDGVNLGDVWEYESLSNSLIPFHKLSQWLTYSLLEPLMEAGFKVVDVEKLTGLSEYRNGGLFLDFGVIELKDPQLVLKEHLPSGELIIEWRALTVCLLDKLGKIVREKLNKTEQEFPLAKVLEGGTWWAGRKIAKSKRDDGGPPLKLKSDGTVF